MYATASVNHVSTVTVRTVLVKTVRALTAAADHQETIRGPA